MLDAFFEKIFLGPVKTIEEVEASLLENISNIELIIERINTAGADLSLKEDLLSICLDTQRGLQALVSCLNDHVDDLNKSPYFLRRIILSDISWLDGECKERMREISDAVDGKMSIMDIVTGIFFWCKTKYTRRAA